MAIKLVLLDSGHGGESQGVYNCLAGGKSHAFKGGIFMEGVNNNLIVQELTRELNLNCGFSTRRVDVDHPLDTTLNRRVEEANMHYDLFRSKYGLKHDEILLLSIHSNAFSDTSVHGFECYANFNNRLTVNIGTRLCEKVSWTRNRGTKDGMHLYMVRKPKANSILVELGFFTHEGDRKFLTSEEGIQHVASYIKQIIQEFNHEQDNS